MPVEINVNLGGQMHLKEADYHSYIMCLVTYTSLNITFTKSFLPISSCPLSKRHLYQFICILTTTVMYAVIFPNL